ncbi:helix-turn-helix transcriptional regulator [Sphingomonas sp. So64.6b]|uniref:helix-turn-helix domain-containing protein n=1 Tax=Sphingomonas sp. So64.6b TaxID=2997354 RepID=UPI0015FFB345|nr:AraC family transcriptional regulator [Sphingomonas sp. So64.6b]QNA84517.1 helix-turn-helix transcriptional regulator [Sphingomonas sp. So64.6b]
MSDIQLDYAVPAADLTDYITLFYHFRADVPVFEDSERADHAQFRIRLSPGDAEYRFPDGSIQSVPDFHVIGPTSGAMQVRAKGPLLVFGMGVTAAGWAAMIGSEASSVLNRAIDANGLFGAARLRTAADAMRAASDVPARVAIGEALVRELVCGGHEQACQFVRQVDGWLAASPSPEMDDLVATTGLSRRQVERKCNAMYGAPPKLLARKYRALRAAVALASDNEDVDDVIARGFYDQSHLIREVKQFTGLTPRQIKAEPGILQRLTMRQRTALDGQVSPLISGT